MSAPFEQLVGLAARVGSDPLHAQGGGGNVSLKLDDELWVKASGTWLSRATQEDGFVRLPLPAAAAHARTPDFAAQMAMYHSPAQRPSIEAPMHALMPHPVVLHAHSVNVIAWASRHDAPAQLGPRLAGLKWGWMPYRRPGAALANGVAAALEAHAGSLDVLVLGNHGLLLGAANCDAAYALLLEVDRRLALSPRPYPPSDDRCLAEANDLGWESACDPEIHAIATDPVTLSVAARGALYPDHAVFLGERALVVPAGHTLSNAVSVSSTAQDVGSECQRPQYALVPGAGVLVAPGTSAGALALLGCLAKVGARIRDAQALAFLAPTEVSALRSWEAEVYRRAREPGAQEPCRS